MARSLHSIAIFHPGPGPPWKELTGEGSLRQPSKPLRMSWSLMRELGCLSAPYYHLSLLTLSKLNYFPKAAPANIITPRVRGSTYEFWGSKNIQSLMQVYRNRSAFCNISLIHCKLDELIFKSFLVGFLELSQSKIMPLIYRESFTYSFPI